MAIWAAFFYFAMIEEINDETDDALENYADQIIHQWLTEEVLPTGGEGSNNSFELKEVSELYATTLHYKNLYTDSMVYIPYKKETEPARILTTVFYHNNNKYYELSVLTPTIEKHDLKESILQWVLILYIALLLTLIGVTTWIFHTSMSPLFILLAWLDRFTLGEKNTPLVNPSNITEFKKLNNAALRNAERQEEAFEHQKQFIGNASHEMQTPLAVSLNRLEMLMEEESLSETQYIQLHKIEETLNRLVKLNKSLLLLSKIDSGQFIEQQEVSINALIEQYKADYQEVYAYKQIALIIDAKEQFILKMDRYLAVVMITNLLKNAFVHGTAKHEIHIHISESMIVFESYSTHKALDEKRIFQRFHQGESAQGSGLGLAIVDSICNRYNLKLSYSFTGAHCFSIMR
jgi:signal transduction histidine kinase